MNFLHKDIGIDLGTANTIVYYKGEIIIREPSVVAVNTRNGDVLAVGEEARAMLGRTPNSIQAIKPLRDGVVADYEITKSMLDYFAKKALKRKQIFKPRLAICVPSGVTEVEKRAVVEAGVDIGAKSVHLVEEPMAAAIGAGLDIANASGKMVVDIGGGTTEIAVMSLGGIVVSESLKVAGNKIDSAIKRYIKSKYKIEIGLRTAESIKIAIGTAKLEPASNESDDTVEEIVTLSAEDKESLKEKKIEKVELTGRDLVTGLPKTIELQKEEAYEAAKPEIKDIINSIKRILEVTPPELASDVSSNGICITGGGALIENIDKLISEEIGVNSYIAENPLDCVALGTGIVSQDLSVVTKGALKRNEL